MVRPLEAAEAEEPSFPDQLLLDFNSGLPYRPPGDAASSSSSAAAAAAGKLHDDALLFRDFFGPGVDRLLELPTDGGDAEEEELEWLVNKDAFPGVETSFEIPSSGGGGGGNRSRGSAAASVGGERPSPISVLAAVSSFSVPVKPRSKGRRVQRRMLVGLTLPPAAKAVARRAAPAERRRCQHCQAEETPQWRAGPRGPKTLCNACGVRYKSGRLVPEYRPASSPTFSADIHSNSHRRIVEMRRQKAATNGGTPQRGRRGLPLLRP